MMKQMTIVGGAMALVQDIAITKGKIYRGGCHCRGRCCLSGPLRQALIGHRRDCFQIAGLSWVRPWFRMTALS